MSVGRLKEGELRVSDFGKCLRSAGEGFFADVDIAVAHGGAFMANESHDDGIGKPGPSGTTQHPVASGAAISSVFEQRDCRIDEGSRGAVSCPFAHHRGPCAYLGWQRIGPKAAAGLAKMVGTNSRRSACRRWMLPPH